MRNGKWILALAFVLLPSLAFAQAWPNEPAGGTIMLDHPFSAILGSGMTNPYNAGSIATDSSAPYSPVSVYRSSISAGSNTGGTELHWYASSPQKEMCVGKWWRTNPEFEGRPQGNKTFFMRGPGTGSVGTYNGVFLFNNQSLSNGTGRMIWIFNTGNLDNSHITGSTDPGVPLFANVSDDTLRVGVWTKLYACIRGSTSNISRDGIIKWWINDRLVGSYSNINYAPAGLNEWVWSETWDGTANFTVSVMWSHFLDHLRIWMGSIGIASGGGGSTTPPSPTPPSPTPPSPTPPPPGTPGTVSNLTVVPQSSTTALVSFTQQDDGTGVPAKYDNRLSVPPINWGSTPSVSSGPCASPFAPAGIIGSTVTCLLSGLTPGQSYQLQNVAFRGTMNQGATYGSLGNIASFTLPSSNVPVITNFSPASGVAGTSITITGTNFGATIGANAVKCNGQTATVTAASPTSLTFTAPDGVTTGKISVQTDQGIVYSEQNFTVGASGSGCGCS